MYRIAIDAMGGDKAPTIVLDGVIKAANELNNVEFILFGQESKVDQQLINHPRITFVHTEQVIDAHDEPSKVIRSKKNSSMIQMAQWVKEGKADAGISAGNTGALMASGIFVVGRMKGVDRPALAPTLPTIDGKGFLLLDVGANIETKVNHLVQYAHMGSVYAEKVRGIKNPRVGLINIGTESHKGTELYRETYKVLSESNLNFVGNIEARDLLMGVVDVAVTDGFTGNQILKTTEGTATALFTLLKKELTSTPIAKIGALLLKSRLRAVKKRMDYSEHGGAALFGLNAPIIKAHGSSDGLAFFNAIRQALFVLDHKVIETINDKFKEMNNIES